MKKFIAVAAILSVMFLGVGPSHALVGMPDDVPGTHVIQPFFLVDMGGFPNTGLDTLVIITDVSGVYGGPTNDRGHLHFEIFNKKSVHMGNGIIDYTPGEVVRKSVRDLLWTHVGNLPDMEEDLDLDTVNETYVGYIVWTGTRDDSVVDNLMAQMYVFDLDNGRAAGANVPCRERAHEDDGYAWLQNNGTNSEVFTGSALSVSDFRERHDDTQDFVSRPLTLTPRWYLPFADAMNYLVFWTDVNHGAIDLPDDEYQVVVYLWDGDENAISSDFNLPYELNIVNVREELPGSWKDGVDDPLGGWFNVPLDASSEWLAYSYQIAESASAGLNWSGLFPVHRNVGDFDTHLLAPSVAP